MAWQLVLVPMMCHGVLFSACTKPISSHVNCTDGLSCNYSTTVSPVSHVSACWLTGLGLGTPSRYLARTISWNACELLLLLLLLLNNTVMQAHATSSTLHMLSKGA